ncbi:MAG: hypothetical protein NVV60_12515 [Luteimonas sp.]|nr:hypothetical protein [Luteimonas sp.]
MLQRLSRWFAGKPGEAPVATVQAAERVPVAMHWQAGTRLPIADWARIADGEDPDWPAERRHAYWAAAAGAWLEALSTATATPLRLRESKEFLLLSALPPRAEVLFLQACERMLARIRRNLGPLANDDGFGKHVAIVFDNHDDYCEYVSHYGPEGGEYAMSSGMYIQAGYGHFALPGDAVDMMEPVIAHELTHCLLDHLPIPAWLNEGLAVNTEQALFPQLSHPQMQLYTPRELAAQHVAYWDADGIQAFWSGKSFLRTDDGNRLSYELARAITAMIANDEPAFRAFVAAADMADGGIGAEGLLGYPLEHLVEAVLGEGDWRPRPETWGEGVERGQFAPPMVAMPR